MKILIIINLKLNCHLVKLGSLCQQLIYFSEQLAKLAQSFNGVGGFPRVVGAVEGRHVGILGPRQEEYAFVNRNGEHSINVMVSISLNNILLNK